MRICNRCLLQVRFTCDCLRLAVTFGGETSAADTQMTTRLACEMSNLVVHDGNLISLNDPEHLFLHYDLTKHISSRPPGGDCFVRTCG